MSLRIAASGRHNANSRSSAGRRGQPGPKPPPKHLSARALTALVSQLTTGYPNPEGPENPPGPLDPYIRKALERSVIGAGTSSHLWRVIAEKHPEIWDVIGGGPGTRYR